MEKFCFKVHYYPKFGRRFENVYFISDSQQQQQKNKIKQIETNHWIIYWFKWTFLFNALALYRNSIQINALFIGEPNISRTKEYRFVYSVHFCFDFFLSFVPSFSTNWVCVLLIRANFYSLLFEFFFQYFHFLPYWELTTIITNEIWYYTHTKHIYICRRLNLRTLAAFKTYFF